MTSALCFCGLGNPGPQYQYTRHNLGFRAVEVLAAALDPRASFSAHKSQALASQLKHQSLTLHFIKPQTFMNLSGQSLRAYCDYYRIPLENIIVFHDELDFPNGALRLKKSGSSAGHNGLKDISRVFGSDLYWRVRSGIGRPIAQQSVSAYVLNALSAEEERIWEQTQQLLIKGLPFLIEQKAAALERLWHTS